MGMSIKYLKYKSQIKSKKSLFEISHTVQQGDKGVNPVKTSIDAVPV